MKIICLHPNLLRRMLEPLGTTEIQRFQGAHGSAAAAAMAPLPGVTNRKLVQHLFSGRNVCGQRAPLSDLARSTVSIHTRTGCRVSSQDSIYGLCLVQINQSSGEISQFTILFAGSS